MRMIERWFPCAEVSEASAKGWGSGKSEKALFTWFAARPLAQAKAAVLTSLLPWPDDPAEQRRLQDLVREAMTGRDAAHDRLVAELAKTYPDGASLLDPFSGRAMIPLEAARLGVRAHGIDYSPVATLAGQLLADYPLRDWSGEPELPFAAPTLQSAAGRLVHDVEQVLAEIGRRYSASMAEFYPAVDGRQPWGYLWAVTLPCQECGRRFPLTGSLVLRHPLPVKDDPGQSYAIEVNRQAGTFRAVVHPGPPVGAPTLVATTKGGKAVRGKSAICPFCEHVHPKALHQRLAQDGLGADALLVAADLDDAVGKRFREPTAAERAAAKRAAAALVAEPGFPGGLPAVPDEEIPAGNNDTVRPSAYGARTYGDLCNPRQTLGFVRLSRIIDGLFDELTREYGVTPTYAGALASYAASVLVRRMRRATRGTTLQPHLHTTSNRVQTHDIFINESAIAFSYDYFETALGAGPATWPSLAGDTVAVLLSQAGRSPGKCASVERGSATALPLPSGRLSAVVTDPPYDSMIDYSDASDLFYVWLKRALASSAPWFSFTADPRGVQEKTDEAIVKRGGTAVADPRDDAHYDRMIAAAFAEARRVVAPDGVVTIVFGHGDPDVWHRLLGSITSAGLVLTGSWPARTESGGSAGSANIVTTLTMACRPAPADRPPGRAVQVEAEVRREVCDRIPMWEQAGLAAADQRMASAGPAMEVVGRYSQVLDRAGNPVDPYEYLIVARRAVDEAADIRVDDLPLDHFDRRTRFALSWVRVYGRRAAPKSEARWEALTADMDLGEVAGILADADKGVRFAYAKQRRGPVDETSAVIDVVLAMASAYPDGLAAVADVLTAAGRDSDDKDVWAVVKWLAARLPEGDADGQTWSDLIRGRTGLGAVSRGVLAARQRADEQRAQQDRQGSLFDVSLTDGDST